MTTTTTTRKPRQAKPFTCTLCTPPICPCEILPQGAPGLVLINNSLYGISTFAVLPEEGEPIVHGYRLSKDDGATYDLPADAGSCECLGHLRWGRCKHQAAVRQLRADGLI